MSIKRYNVFLKGKDLHECYKKFTFDHYKNYLKKIGSNYIFDFQDVAMILYHSLIDEEALKRDKENGVNNLDLIGKESNIKKVVKDIKLKGFKLEEIIQEIK